MHANKSIKIRKSNGWLISGSILFILSFAIIPLLIYSTGSTWQSITVFAADIALLTSIIVILMALNGLLSIYISFRHLRVTRYKVPF